MKRLYVTLFRAAAGLVVACAACGAPPDGLWQSDGYGYFIEIKGADLKAYELTSISCVPSFTVQRKSDSAGEIVFASDEDLIRIFPGKTPDEARLHSDGAASDIILHRIEARPKTCEHPPEDTPPSNYAIFWQTFAEHYAFFDLRHVNWQEVDKRFRPQVTSATQPKELFQILQQMIEPLQDAHTSVFARGIKGFHGMRPDPLHLTPDEWVKVNDMIDSKYMQGKMQVYCNGHVQFGKLNDLTGYLRVNAFNSYSKGGYMEELHALEAALDDVFRDSKPLRGLVIDVRRNNGGADPLGIEIASRLTGAKYLAYRKVTRNNLSGPLHFTEPQDVWVEPSARPGFRGAVVLLTGPDTISAGETFAMALMGREPHVTRIGQNTQGVFSDVLGRRLPNGWRFGLPNEVYLTGDGNTFDGPGVPPDLLIPFSKGDSMLHKDVVLEKALETLQPGR